MRNLLTVTCISLLLMSCSSQPTVEPEEKASEEKAATEPTVEKKDMWGWDYTSGPRGPKNWASLNPQYDMCSSGKAQSPVNLVWHKPSSPNPLTLHYKAGNATIMNTGNTFRIELTPQSSITYNGVDYLLEKIEIRSPSEHSLSGNQLPMELQFYHRSSSGLKQAIVSLLVITGRGSSWFDELWQKTQNLENYKSSPTFKFNPEQLIPPRRTFYHYEGSLTHPPCLENVQWFVFNTPLQLSQEQIAEFRKLFGPNNRPLQPLNDRKVTNF